MIFLRHKIVYKQTRSKYEKSCIRKPNNKMQVYSLIDFLTYGSTGQTAIPLHGLTTLQRLVFLVNSHPV